MAWQTIGSTDDVRPGDAVQVSLGGKTIALFNVSGAYFALEDACPHRGAPLSEGPIEGDAVVCPWHAAKFDLKTGAHLCPPAARGVATFSVRVEAGMIQIDA